MLPAAAMNAQCSSALQQIVKVPGTCFVQPAAPSPACPCSDESAVGFPVLERELPSLSGRSSEIQFRSKHDYTSSYKVSGIPSYMSCYLAVSFYLICSLDLSAILYPGWWCDALMESTLYMPQRCIPQKKINK